MKMSAIPSLSSLHPSSSKIVLPDLSQIFASNIGINREATFSHTSNKADSLCGNLILKSISINWYPFGFRRVGFISKIFSQLRMSKLHISYTLYALVSSHFCSIPGQSSS